MKILYFVSFPYGMGADRWIYTGFRHAFLDKGHDFITMTETENLKETLLSVKPDIFLIGFPSLILRAEQEKIEDSFFKKIFDSGIKIFASIGVEFKDQLPSIKRYSPYVAVFHANYVPVVEEFKKLLGRPCHFILN